MPMPMPPMPPMPMMQMVFTASTHVTILFQGLTTNTTWEYVAALFVCALLAVLQEILTLVRELRTATRVKLIGGGPSLLADDQHEESQAFNRNVDIQRAVVDALLYGLSMSLAYVIMLIVMTFDVGLFFAVMFGFVVSVRAHNFICIVFKSHSCFFGRLDTRSFVPLALRLLPSVPVRLCVMRQGVMVVCRCTSVSWISNCHLGGYLCIYLWKALSGDLTFLSISGCLPYSPYCLPCVETVVDPCKSTF